MEFGTYSLHTSGRNKKDSSRKPKKMSLSDIIWLLIKLWLKHGNVDVKTWVQNEGFVDLYEPKFEPHRNIVSIY